MFMKCPPDTVYCILYRRYMTTWHDIWRDKEHVRTIHISRHMVAFRVSVMWTILASRNFKSQQSMGHPEALAATPQHVGFWPGFQRSPASSRPASLQGLCVLWQPSVAQDGGRKEQADQQGQERWKEEDVSPWLGRALCSISHGYHHRGLQANTHLRNAEWTHSPKRTGMM